MATQKTKAQLLTDIGTKFPDNITEDISPADLRSFLEDLLESIYNKTDEGGSFPLFGYKVIAGQLHWNATSFDTLETTGNEVLNTGGTVSTDTDKIRIDASPSVDSWVCYMAQMNSAWGEIFDLPCSVDGDEFAIHPKLAGAKVEIAQLAYNSGAGTWDAVGGGGTTMTIGSSSANQIVLTHASNCGNNPAWITPRTAARQVYANTSLSSLGLTVNLTDAAGAAYTPANGERISIGRLAFNGSTNQTIDPNTLTAGLGRISYFGIYKPS